MRFLTSLIFYFYPVFYGCYTFNKYTNVVFRFDTTYSNFLYQEVFLFMGVILSGMVLMCGLFIFKYTSLWKEAILRETKDLWQEKDNDDILNYFAFEFRTFTLHFPMMLRELDLYWRTKQGDKETAGSIEDMFILLFASRAIALALFFY